MAESKEQQVTLDRKGTDRSLQLAQAAARTAADHKGKNIVVLDLREQTPLFDYFVIATGTSSRQLRAMSEEIDHMLEDELGDRRLSISGFNESRWIVLDYGTVLIHLFDEATRGFYDLEHLWADSRRVDVAGLPPAGSVAGHSVTTGNDTPGLRLAE